VPSKEPPPPDRRSSSAERRDVERVEVLGTLDAAVLISQPVEITEISGAGLQILSRFPFLLDSLHEFRLTLDQRSVVVKGRITHCSIIDIDPERVQYRSGVDLTEIPAPVAALIADYAASLRQRRGGSSGAMPT
jgi:hypothetical protein